MTNKEAIKWLNKNRPCILMDCNKYNTENINMATDMAIRALKERPTGEWITVNEGLPDDAFGCLVTIMDTDRRTQEEYEYVLHYAVGYDGETWNDCDGEVIPYEVIAWQPLPKPYKEAENDKS